MMQKAVANELVQQTLRGNFNKEHFIFLVKNLLNTIDESKAFHARGYVKEKYKQQTGVIKTYERIGTYTSPEEKKIDILIVYLQKEGTIDRARTTLRNFVADYLKSRGQKDAALVAFVSPDGNDWRLSLVKMEYKFNEKGKIKEEFTPARRYSFLVGKKENSHTAQSRLLPLLLNDEVNPSLLDLENVFSVEQVTKEFFEKYRDLFLRLKESLDEIVKKDAKVETDLKQKNVDTVDFSKKLLGQIVFLYFLQKKGWFGVKRGNEWGSGSKHFLKELFEKKHGDYNNFFNDLLEPLFYEALRLERPGDYYSRFDCRIPFLNGGLFDPINDYDWWDTDILLADDVFSNDRRTKEGDSGDGILDVFDRYNFTVKEDEPLEKEVAVDPEMLGKVFENLLEVKNRKSKGTYYTPREIVHYMCQEGLANYLATALDGKISKVDIETLIKYGESAIEHDSRVVTKGRETGRYSFKLPQSVRKRANLIDEKLADIRVCDPAVGSGAFPVGMMNEIVRTRNALTPYLGENGERSPYDFKRYAIQNCLYGVDIDSGAVEICKLRLWLSLVVDEETREQVQPLPNLDYKIVCGNSLFGVEKNLFNQKLFNRLEELKPLYFNETSAGKKQSHKKAIDDIISQITNGHSEFDFEIYFSEVFHEKGGFDVVIANPPYVRADSGAEYLSFRKELEETKKYQTLYEKWDLLVPFLEGGLDIINSKGDLVYIVSNAVCTSKYALKLLDLIQKDYFPRSVDYFEGMAVFDAGVTPVVIQVAKSNVDDKTKKIIRSNSFGNIVRKTELSTKEFKALGRDAFRKDYNPILMTTHTLNLGDICYISYGLRPNSDERYWKGEFKTKDVVSDKKSDINSQPFIEGKDLAKYKIKRIRYLEWGTDRVPRKISRPTFPELYDPPKIIRGRMNPAVLDETKIKCSANAIVLKRYCDLKGITNRSISTSIKKLNKDRKSLEDASSNYSLKYLLAILNSNFAYYYLNNIRRHEMKNYFYPDDLKKLPIQKAMLEDQKPLIVLVDSILSLTKSNDYFDDQPKVLKVKELEKQIDQFVYKLYDLTEEEIAIVEKISN